MTIALRVDWKRKPPMVAWSSSRRMGLKGDRLAVRSRAVPFAGCNKKKGLDGSRPWIAQGSNPISDSAAVGQTQIRSEMDRAGSEQSVYAR